MRHINLVIWYYWVNQDEVTAIDPYLMCSVYEAEIIRGAQQDLLEAMQLADESRDLLSK